ncbi:MAG: DUF4105 domain-containing protein [Oligoflexus sp.]|nr:DUF4105 domain-containing protein [Oligoflexus sp.]
MHKTYLKSCKSRVLRGALFLFTVTVIFHLQLLFCLPALRAETQGTTARSSWRHLLYYSNRTFTRETSLVDSPEFFLAKDGAYDSDHELTAFMEALKRDDPKKPEADRIACRFPARSEWVRRNRPELRFASAPCPDYEAWLAFAKPKAVSLIFSSYFLNNPSSMMGHTFLRLRRGTATSAPLLDKAVNFAAEPTTDIPMLYSIMGLTGSFPGKFAIMPYYSKVQEYANAESRDLWEYDLNFTEVETRAMMASLWELAPQRIDYYFFDENCSAVLLFLIQSARPTLDLSHKLGFWVHPSDTVRIVMEEKDLVSEIVYRPSTRSRYLAQYKVLSLSERALLLEMQTMQTDDFPGFQALIPDRKALLLDAALAFIEFDESLYGSKKPVKNALLYERVLEARSKLNTPPMTQFATPEDEAPHLGHKGQRWGLGLGFFEEKAEMLLEYRPGPHDLISPAIGYPPELSIELGRSKIAVEEGGKLRIRSAEIFHILSFNPSRSGRFPWSWQMQFNYENTESKRLNLSASIGQAYAALDRDHYLFGFFNTRLKAERGELWACPGLSAGGRYSLGKRLVSFSELSLERCYASEVRPWLGQWSQSFRYSIDSVWEIYLDGKRNSDSQEFGLGFYRYY